MEVETLAVPIFYGGQEGGLVFVRDITERKKAEEERLRLEQRLQLAEKAESLGRMAGAIAHNFNNVLTVVIGNLELIKDEARQRVKLEKYVNQALMASQRAATISRFMLTYLGQTKGKAELLDPIAAVTGTCSLLSATLPGNVHLITELPPAATSIKCDAAHLTQILTNLITNSLEAIGEKEGEIVVALDTVPRRSLKPLQLFPLNWEPTADAYVCLSVRDTGHGIDPENLNKVFDPFFSTKFAGRGLGLSVVLGLLHGFQGAVSVDNNPDRGATFKLYLPVSEEDASSRRRDEAPLPADDAAGGLVLVVDDEAIIRNLAESILERKFGYQVLTACDGFEALEIFKARKDEICLVILDLVMPGIDGWATLSALREVQPEITVILSSGYDEAQVSRGAHMELPQAFLPKPYGVKDLEAAMVIARRATFGGGGSPGDVNDTP